MRKKTIVAYFASLLFITFIGATSAAHALSGVNDCNVQNDGKEDCYLTNYPTNSSVFQKALYTSALSCYLGTGVLKNTTSLAEFSGLYSLYDFRYDVYSGSDISNEATSAAWVPAIGDYRNNVFCGTVLSKIIAKPIPTLSVTESQKEAVLKEASYNRGSDKQEACFDYYYNVDIFKKVDGVKVRQDTEEGVPNGTVCINSNNQWEIRENASTNTLPKSGKRIYISGHDNVISYSIVNNSNSKKLKVKVDVEGTNVNNIFELNDGDNPYQKLADVGQWISNKQSTYGEEISGVDLGSGSSIIQINPSCIEYKYGSNAGGNPGVYCYSAGGLKEEYSSIGRNVTYTKEVNKNRIISASSGGSFKEEKAVKFTDQEIYDLYSFYLTDQFHASDQRCYDGEQALQSTKKVKLWDGERQKYNNFCYIRVDEQRWSDLMVYGVSTVDRKFGVPISAETMIGVLNGDDFNKDANPPEQIIDDNDAPDEGAIKTCMNSAATGSMAWIVCPLGESMGEAIKGIYEKFLEPMLMVNTNVFEMDDERAGTFGAWSIFRDIANGMFVIIFLVIIFSQLTGVGIDNYGIKKILPKLIIAAILINLSYYICILCVDVSNIVGNGIRGIFANVSPAISSVSLEGGADLIAQSGISVPDATAAASGVASAAGIAIIILIGLCAYFFVSGALEDPSTLIPLLLALIGAIVAVLFLFISLAVRQAGIIFFTVISPIAFVCYILPNTKKYFDKMKDTFWKLLLVYPVCGVLIGGGDFVSRLLINAGGGSLNFLQLLVAMAAGIAPLFFIPQLLTTALNAMGGLGTKLQGLGNAMKRGAQNTVGNSKQMQEAKRLSAERAQRLQTARRSGIRYNRLTGRARTDENGNLMERNGLRERFARSRVGEFLGAKDRMGEAREKYTGMYAEREKHQNTADEMRTVHAQLNTARDAESKRLGTADEGVVVGDRANYAAMQLEKNRDTRAMNEFGYVAKSEGQANAERINANRAATAKYNRPDALKDQHVFDSEQELKNRQTRSLNTEGLAIASQDVLNAEQANKNVEVNAKNREGVARVAQAVADAEQANRNVQVNAKNNEGVVRISQAVADAELANINVRAEAKNVEGVARMTQAVANAEQGNQNVQIEAKNTEGVARVSQEVANAELANANVHTEAKNTEGVAVVSQDVANMEQRNAVTVQNAKNDVGVTEITQANAIQRAQNERTKSQAAEDAGVAAITYDNELQRAQNQRIETEAAEDVGVVAVTRELAHQRAESRVNAQELKNAQDMYGAMNREEIQQHVNDNFQDLITRGAGGDRGAMQQAIALYNAAQGNGLEGDAYEALRHVPADQIDPTFKSALTSSGDKLTQAWAKSAPVPVIDPATGQQAVRPDGTLETRYMTFEEFLQSGGANGGDVGLRHYLSEKGDAIVPSLNDKILRQIREAEGRGSGEVISTHQLAKIASSGASQDTINEANLMLNARSDISFSGEDLTNLDVSTFNIMFGQNREGGQARDGRGNPLPLNQSGIDALRTAYDSIRGDTQLMAKVDPAVRQRLESEFGPAQTGP